MSRWLETATTIKELRTGKSWRLYCLCSIRLLVTVWITRRIRLQVKAETRWIVEMVNLQSEMKIELRKIVTVWVVITVSIDISLDGILLVITLICFYLREVYLKKKNSSTLYNFETCIRILFEFKGLQISSFLP